ncbi:imidazole glycerol phosphate synthase subunit HisH [Leptolyngbya sp. FACHB-261]|uniref:imidazole glycerol phosphate synthase subunit HisH n=1 Tax=Leptolyngbya sp. FACHB-261 TaxID=2692806 RepID=UPI001688452C|nr:imidazole glycerol phosphate synthase subunit HisH [Leptolyngbya sp. FACHB-261]MBD2100142.1 imidazole glycerol phosphate synthase subunit HisH [Leptolyngbya sp. FACHB-261]
MQSATLEASEPVLIAVIDYDMGNLHSACKGLERAGARTLVTNRPEDLEQAAAVVLPGVGAFDPAMQHLRSRDLEGPIRAVVASGKPFLGICLGLQILFEGSEEGIEPGLGLLPGVVKRFATEPSLTIPHMGWNQLDLVQKDCALWQGLSEQSWVYFVHSYYVQPSDPAVCAATVCHGSQTVTAAVAQDNLMAVQFHPEKSSTAGLQILANFVAQVKRRQQQYALAH